MYGIGYQYLRRGLFGLRLFWYPLQGMQFSRGPRFSRAGGQSVPHLRLRGRGTRLQKLRAMRKAPVRRLAKHARPQPQRRRIRKDDSGSGCKSPRGFQCPLSMRAFGRAGCGALQEILRRAVQPARRARSGRKRHVFRRLRDPAGFFVADRHSGRRDSREVEQRRAVL